MITFWMIFKVFAAASFAAIAFFFPDVHWSFKFMTVLFAMDATALVLHWAFKKK
jgi:hypothetical protein